MGVVNVAVTHHNVTIEGLRFGSYKRNHGFSKQESGHLNTSSASCELTDLPSGPLENLQHFCEVAYGQE